jgi:hypothetical protein
VPGVRNKLGDVRMSGQWSSAYLRAELAPAWAEVDRDLSAQVLDTILTDDGKVFIVYDGRRFAVVPAHQGGSK